MDYFEQLPLSSLEIRIYLSNISICTNKDLVNYKKIIKERKH